MGEPGQSHEDEKEVVCSYHFIVVSAQRNHHQLQGGSIECCLVLVCLLAYFERTRTPLTSFIHSFRFSMMFFSSAMLKPV